MQRDWPRCATCSRLCFQEEQVSLQKPTPCIVLILAGALDVFRSNLTVSSSKTSRGGLSGDEGKGVRRRRLPLVFSGGIVSSQFRLVTARVFVN